MKKNSVILIILGLVLFSCSKENFNPVSYVDPFIGTGLHGHVYPGATLPFGMVQLSPDNGTNGWDWCSGYHYSDSLISGLSHTHLSGTGIGDLADILFLPSMQDFNIPDEGFKGSLATYNRSLFSHEDETASPGYYSVVLSNGVTAELTATERCGVQRYTASSDGVMKVLIDLGFAINWDRPTECFINYGNGEVTGLRRSSGWAKDQYQYFTSRFSIQPTGTELYREGEFVEGDSIAGPASAMILKFDMRRGDELVVKTALSAVSIAGAINNLDKELPGWNFDRVARQARKIWNSQLGKIKVETNDHDRLKVFYTSLYHSFLAPVTYSDTDGSYRGADGKTHVSEGFTNYTVFSLWDTFRAAHPLYTIVEPERVPDMINSMLRIYREQGKLPVWSLMANETNTMIGYHAVPVIADAISKGIKGFDYNLAYEAAKHSSMLDFRGLKYYIEKGWVPSDLENESVSKTLEYAYDDWCIASIAKTLGDTAGYNTYIERSGYYSNIYDPSSGFMRGRLADGSFKEPFDPLYSSHRQDEYTEGNAWQYTWFVPHDINGLALLMGGRNMLLSKLDSLFLLDEGVRGENASSDISGLIGGYAHGNEPGHHTAYIYSVLDERKKTEILVRRILNEMYHDGVDGLCGNEDCGQMSAWYIFSSIGFYPFNPADGKYYFGSPVFDRVTISLPQEGLFVIETVNNSAENIHISHIELNGQAIDRNFITHKEIMAGGTLKFYMSAE